MTSLNAEFGDEQQLQQETKFAELKRLLLADEHTLLTDLQQRLQDGHDLLEGLRERLGRVEDRHVSREEFEERLAAASIDADRLSDLLPSAVQQASQRDQELSAALGPILASAFQESVKRNPQALADAVSPIIGPAIRRAISQAIAGMVQSLNQTLEHTFSPQGVRWRWEAFTTGKPFAEVVLLHSLLYKVEHIFLIHSHDGIVLQHVSSLPQDATDADLVSGMLTALQDFVRDSLGATKSDELEDMRVGDRTVWIEHGSSATLAAVIRGHPPESLRESLMETIEKVHREYGTELRNFDGDATPLANVEGDLRECLVSAQIEKKKKNLWLPIAGWTAGGLALLVAMGWYGMHLRKRSLCAEYRQLLAAPQSVELDVNKRVLVVTGAAHDDWIQHAQRAGGALNKVQQVDLTAVENLVAELLDCSRQLREQPGILIVRAERHGDTYRLEGLRDPLAQDPIEILKEHGLDHTQSVFRAYHSMAPDFVLARAQRQLGHPEGIEWSIQDEVLTIKGEASHLWLSKVRRYAEQLTDVQLNLDQVTDRDLAEVYRLRDVIEEQVVMHREGAAELLPDSVEKLDQLATQIIELQDRSQAMDEIAQVVVVGYADPDEDSPSTPMALSELRARRIWRELVNRSVPENQLLIRARGSRRLSATSGDSDHDWRCCMFDVRLGSEF